RTSTRISTRSRTSRTAAGGREAGLTIPLFGAAALVRAAHVFHTHIGLAATCRPSRDGGTMAATGWWGAFAFVRVIGGIHLTYPAGLLLGLHPTAFLLEAFLFGGISLLLIAKPGENAHKIIFAPQTWAYGAATIAGEIFYYVMIVFVPPADASVFMRVTILLTIVLGWLVVGRRITPLRGLGIALGLGDGADGSLHRGLFLSRPPQPAVHRPPPGVGLFDVGAQPARRVPSLEPPRQDRDREDAGHRPRGTGDLDRGSGRCSRARG